MPKILIVDDEVAIRNVLKDIFSEEGYTVECAVDGFEALNLFKANTYDVVMCDIKMPKIDGIDFLEKATKLKPEVPIIILSGNEAVQMAMDAVRNGAFDYISKPPDLNRMLITVRNALEKSNLIVETQILKQKANITTKMVGASKELDDIKNTIDKVAPTDARVLILGENGSGKELVARLIHEKSSRNGKPLIEVNCAAIPSELIESELFGHEKGSFTSAVKQRLGKFELANGGTLFLDEVGDMSHDAQAKVLRALQEGKITRIGGEKEINVDVRVIAATNKNLLEEVANKNFRLDLYHRLSVIIIKVPSLNNRLDDIPLLVNHFLEIICNDYKMPLKNITNDALTELKKHNWTGNIRELNNAVARLVILSDKEITKTDVQQFVTIKL
jgi:two-component system, NtrC family, nitrogen regulation response regulator NtrX